MAIKRAVLSKSDRKNKEYKVILYHGDAHGNDKAKTLHFGSNMDSYPDHKDLKRKKSYIARHKPRENWKKSGIKTAGFWSKHLLWNKPTIQQSVRDIERNFNIEISI